jgi:hypothetical protein
MTRFLASALAGVLLVASDVQAGAATAAGDTPTFNRPTAADDAAIRHLLDTYTNSVSTGDRATFESQLLDLAIPFSAVKQGAHAMDKTGLAAVQDYAGFRKAIFDSGRKYQQRFSNIRIEQLGNLAQVSLDYQTALQGETYEGRGWKVLHLLKLDGQWKIASEFYTGYPLH